MITFETLRYKNFLSSGKEFTEIKFNEHKTTLVIGQNGAGKSTMLDALSFVLYGKPYRDLTQERMLNSINKKDLLVELEFSVNQNKYKIIRGIKPKKFELYKNDELVNQTAANKDYQTLITDDILKITHKSFSQIVILGSANYQPFMKLDVPTRRKVVEDILDLSVFSVMNDMLKEKVKENKESITNVDVKITLVKNKLEINKKHLESIKESNDELVNLKKEKIVFYEQKNEEMRLSNSALQKEIAEYQEKLDALSERIDKFSGISDIIYKLKQKIDKNTKEINFFSETNVCPTCSQTISEDFKSECVNELHAKTEKANRALEDAIKSQIKHDNLNDNYSEISINISSLNRRLSENNAAIAQYNRFIKDLYDDISVIQEKNETFRVNDDSIELNTELDNLLSEKDELIKHKEVLMISAQLLKDGGIKSIVIKQFISEINKIVNYYLESLDFFVQFELDENFNETIKSRYRDVFCYENFSEGEKARIDLSLLFTWRHIARLRNSISTNLLIMDEVFDGSLDSIGSDDLIKVLNFLTENSNVVIISHKTDQLLDKFDNVIKFSKVKNFSVMEK